MTKTMTNPPKATEAEGPMSVLDATRARLLAEIDRTLGGPAVKEVYIAVFPPR